VLLYSSEWHPEGLWSIVESSIGWHNRISSR